MPSRHLSSPSRIWRRWLWLKACLRNLRLRRMKAVLGLTLILRARRLRPLPKRSALALEGVWRAPQIPGRHRLLQYHSFPALVVVLLTVRSRRCTSESPRTLRCASSGAVRAV